MVKHQDARSVLEDTRHQKLERYPPINVQVKEMIICPLFNIQVKEMNIYPLFNIQVKEMNICSLFTYSFKYQNKVDPSTPVLILSFP